MSQQTVSTLHLIREIVTAPFQHMGPLLRIMGLIWLLRMPDILSENWLWPEDGVIMLGVPAGPLSITIALISLLAGILGASWAEVGWHRLVLLKEQPLRFTPRPHVGVTLLYLFRTVLLLILTVGIPIGSAYFIGEFFANTGFWPVSTALLIGSILFALWLTIRLSPWLVAAAVGDTHAINEAYQDTAHLNRSIMGLIAVLVAVVVILLVILMGWEIFGTGSVFNANGFSIYLVAIRDTCIIFLFSMLYLSILSTIYRHSRLSRGTTDEIAERFR